MQENLTPAVPTDVVFGGWGVFEKLSGMTSWRTAPRKHVISMTDSVDSEHPQLIALAIPEWYQLADFVW